MYKFLNLEVQKSVLKIIQVTKGCLLVHQDFKSRSVGWILLSIRPRLSNSVKYCPAN